jgi:RNA polymerase sigma-70 factor (ECF subfamily)
LAGANILKLQSLTGSMNNKKDGILLARADSSVVFENVFRSHYQKLHLYACTIVKDAATAEEIVQNVFYKLWEKRNKLQVQKSLAAYLYRSVHNESLNFLKHEKVRAAHNKYVRSVNSEEGNSTDPMHLRELQQNIDLALNNLPQQCRTIFQLSRFENLKYNEIAAQLNISVKTVENQMGKALRLLRLKLIDYLPLICLLVILKK